MSYKLNTPNYEAVQLGSGEGAQDTFIATVDPDSSQSWTKNEDGSLDVSTAAGPRHFEPTDWEISSQYYGEFPGWDGPGRAAVADADFWAQYSAE